MTARAIGAVASGRERWPTTITPSDSAGALYRLDADGSVTRILDGIGISNGTGWSPDDRTMYYVDSLRYRIDALDYDIPTGAATHRRPWLEIDPSAGLPDGLTVDRDGGVWLVLHGQGRVHRYRPGGLLDVIVEVPARRTTSCAFGGAGLRALHHLGERSRAIGHRPARRSRWRAVRLPSGLCGYARSAIRRMSRLRRQRPRRPNDDASSEASSAISGSGERCSRARSARSPARSSSASAARLEPGEAPSVLRP